MPATPPPLEGGRHPHPPEGANPMSMWQRINTLNLYDYIVIYLAFDLTEAILRFYFGPQLYNLWMRLT